MKAPLHSACLIGSLVFCLILPSLPAQQIGDRVRLESTNPKGVPVHPAAGDPSYYRWANATEGLVKQVDPATGWFEVEVSGQRGWITKTYLVVITPTDEIVEEERLSYVVGTWNLEWFKEGASRGFPEYNYGGPRYSGRTAEDVRKIAEMIRDKLVAKILVLTEINGLANGRSLEMDRLVANIGTGWKYRIGTSGQSQRVAILYDSGAVREDKWLEIPVPREVLDGSDIFARDPVVAKFTLLDRQGDPQNDLVIVGLHLASKQELIQNHNRAMLVLKDKLHALWRDGTIPSGERDILIMGDLNASRYDVKKEDFWENYDPEKFKFKTLSPLVADEYPGTRLAGVPLFPRSKIDYIIGSNLAGGMLDQLVLMTAHVHADLLPQDFNEFRRVYSDHLPVTIAVKVVPDDD